MICPLPVSTYLGSVMGDFRVESEDQPIELPFQPSECKDGQRQMDNQCNGDIIDG